METSKWSGPSIAVEMTRRVNVASYMVATREEVTEGNEKTRRGMDRYAPLAFHSWLNSGRQSIILTVETMAALLAVEIPAHDEYPLRPGQAYELLFSEPMDDPWMAPERVWGGIMYCDEEDGWVWVDALLMSGANHGDMKTGHGQPILECLFALQGERMRANERGSGYGESLCLALAALRALLNPATATATPIRLSSPTRRRQAKKAGQRMLTLTLRDEGRGTLRIVQPVEREQDQEPADDANKPPVAAHTVRSHGQLYWVRAPRPGEHVEGRRISKTVVVDGVEHHTYLYGVRRQRKAHVRGQGCPATFEPRFTVLQGGE